MSINKTLLKQVILVVLIGLVCSVLGYFAALRNVELSGSDDVAPKIYVARCGFQFDGERCGDLAKSAVFQSSDELLSYTDNWAVGRVGPYKMYVACFSPGDEKYIDGTFSTFTIAVAGPNLSDAFALANQLITDVSAELPEHNGSVSHCIE